MSINGDILPVDGYGPDVGYADMSTVPVVESVRAGWEVDTDVAIADLEYNGEPLALSPRAALKRAVAAWRSLGYDPHLGFEMEFYVMQPDAADAPGGYGPLRIPSHRVYGVGLGGDNTGLMFDLYDAAEQCELDLEGVLGEFHPGQMEVNLRYGPAVDAADRAFICKEMTREVAARKRYWITYMGRPMAHLVGSGLHVNMSLCPAHSDARRVRRAVGRTRAVDIGAAVHRRPHRPPRSDGGDVGTTDQQLQTSGSGHHRRLLGQLGPGQPDQHVPSSWSTRRGNTDRESASMRQRESVPRCRRDVECGAARRGRRQRLLATRRSVTATPHPTRIDTRRTISKARSSPSKRTACCAKRWAAIWSRRSARSDDDEVDKWRAADGLWDVRSISAWELEQYLPFY